MAVRRKFSTVTSDYEEEVEDVVERGERRQSSYVLPPSRMGLS